MADVEELPEYVRDGVEFFYADVYKDVADILFSDKYAVLPAKKKAGGKTVKSSKSEKTPEKTQEKPARKRAAAGKNEEPAPDKKPSSGKKSAGKSSGKSSGRKTGGNAKSEGEQK